MFRSLTIATINVRGLNSRKKQFHLSQYLELLSHVDVLAIQETKISTEEDSERLVNSLFRHRYDVVVSHALGHSAGCLLLIKQIERFRPVMYATDTRGRMAMSDVLIDNVLWRFICVYAPVVAKERESFFLEIRERVRSSDNVVLLGDFNCILSRRDRGEGVVRVSAFVIRAQLYLKVLFSILT